MIGDSITHHWGGEPSGDGKNTGAGSWEKLFRPHTATNMGFGFDYVDNAYYRVQNGELDGISPRVIIVLLGTNNLGHRKDTPQACADNFSSSVAASSTTSAAPASSSASRPRKPQLTAMRGRPALRDSAT